jgi:selenocysteine lyase/cysteine desulfurase
MPGLNQAPFEARLGDRSLFPRLVPRAFLNHAAISPPSLAVEAAVAEVVGSYAEVGVAAVRRWIAQREELRGLLASLVGASPAEIGFVANTTRGVTDIALCLPWKAGDRVVCFSGEFPANVTPWQRAAELHGLELVMAPLADFERPGGPELGRLEALLKRGVRLVACSAVQFQTGLRMPLRAMADLCHAHGAELFVDGIQAVGSTPLDVRAEGIDYLSCGSHKWLMGLEGCAFVYVREGLAAKLRPHVAGWLSHEDGLAFLFGGAGLLRYDRPIKATPAFFEGGAPNTAGFAAWQASAGLIAGLGVPAIGEHIAAYHDALEPGLLRRGFISRRHADAARRSGILSVVPPPGLDVATLAAELNAAGISVTTPDGHLRFAPSWPNSLAEVPGVLEALDAAAC